MITLKRSDNLIQFCVSTRLLFILSAEYFRRNCVYESSPRWAPLLKENTWTQSASALCVWTAPSSVCLPSHVPRGSNLSTEATSAFPVERCPYNISALKPGTCSNLRGQITVKVTLRCRRLCFSAQQNHTPYNRMARRKSIYTDTCWMWTNNQETISIKDAKM